MGLTSVPFNENDLKLVDDRPPILTVMGVTSKSEVGKGKEYPEALPPVLLLKALSRSTA